MKEFGWTVLALFLGFIAARLAADIAKKQFKLPIATGDIPRVDLGTETALGIRPAS